MTIPILIKSITVIMASMMLACSGPANDGPPHTKRQDGFFPEEIKSSAVTQESIENKALQTPGGRATNSSWESMVASLSTPDAEYLSKINKRYYNTLAYKDSEELNRLLQLGFPRPEEWINARSKSDKDLEAAVASGDTKAMIFLADRKLDLVDPFLKLRATDDAAYRASPGYEYAQQAYELGPLIQTKNKSAFAGYLLGSMYAELNYPFSEDTVVAGMLLALDRGDRRAIEHIGRYAKSHPNMSFNKAYEIYETLK